MTKEKIIVRILEVFVGIMAVLVITSLISIIYALFAYGNIPSVLVAMGAIFYIIYDKLTDIYNRV